MVKSGNLMGISMGSSEGAGYCDVDGHLMGWINELCYCQLDLNPEAPYDPWTPHSGTSHVYLGQRGATKLAVKGGVDVPPELRPEHPEMNTMKHEGHAKCLKLIQAAMKDPSKEPQARKIYETIGVYFGYAIAQYSEHYDIDNVLVLGRVSSGAGGELMLEKAKEVLQTEFPALKHIKFHVADEHFKRVGQCIAAAALPPLRGRKALSRMLLGDRPPARVHVGAAHGSPDPPMSEAAKKVLLVKPKIQAPLDPDFAPVILGKKKYYASASSCKERLEWALIRHDGVGRGTLPVFPAGHQLVDASIHLAGVLIQSMLWQRSAYRLDLCGPAYICAELQTAFSATGKFQFEVRTMPKVCGHPDKPFEVFVVPSPKDLPLPKDTPQVCGSDANGCRLAFDLGKSDIKTVAVKDNEVISSKETEWDVTNPDPQYHYDVIVKAMKATAAKLPGKVEAIGGSATGAVSADSEATWCDCFPNVPPDVYKEKVVPIFTKLAKEFGDVPLKVINDGEVTALAGMMMVKEGNLLGISMGSSEGGGYCDIDGHLLGWINELCYIQLDLNPDAPYDPWTPHSGTSHMYLGQRAATRLATKGGVDVPEEMKPESPEMNTMKHESHAKCLKLIQAAMKDPSKEPQARKIYETVGVYLGYALAQYVEDYEVENVLILGRVSSGAGGEVMLAKAKEVLETEFPEILGIKFHQADEHFKRVGQCVAAAALPRVRGRKSMSRRLSGDE
mmetsp:Transcript_72594/g.192837  ORF Transcript_72594/g.192837 Transcript_72594/m.192837 type:complete len:730 (-) Transcript_72594:212-2401(-)